MSPHQEEGGRSRNSTIWFSSSKELPWLRCQNNHLSQYWPDSMFLHFSDLTGTGVSTTLGRCSLVWHPFVHVPSLTYFFKVWKFWVNINIFICVKTANNFYAELEIIYYTNSTICCCGRKTLWRKWRKPAGRNSRFIGIWKSQCCGLSG